MADAKAASRKRRLSDMDADEFMMYGLDDDSSEDERGEEDEKQTAKVDAKISTKSKTAKHKKDLSRLQKKDPEFYKFLQDNDQTLLRFNDSDTDEEDEEESDDDDADDDEKESKQSKTKSKSKTIKKKKKKTEESDDDAKDSGNDLKDDNVEDIEDDNEKDTPEKKKGKLVTLGMIKQWRKGLESMSLQSLRQAMRAFRAGVYGALGEMLEEKKSRSKTPKIYRVEGSSVFNAIIQLCLKLVPPVLNHHVGEASIKNGKLRLPSSNEHWAEVKGVLKFYLTDILQLLRSLADPSMLCVMIKHAQQLSSYFACYPNLTKQLIKRLVRMWGTGDEHVRVVAFLGINKLLRMLPSTLLEFCLKQLYLSFVKNAKFTSPKTKPLITFMQNSLVEVFKVNPHLTYQHAFIYIRQMAIHLRNAIINKKKDAHQSVYNWQFIHCLHLWCRVLSEVSSQGVLDPLLYPLVQIIMGTIKLVPTCRYYPLRFHCIRSLHMLSQAMKTFVPTSSFLLEILDSPEFNKRVKMSTAKPTDFSCILKVSKSQLSTKPFEDAVIDNVFELFLEFFSIHAYSIAFPELSLSTVVRLRKFIKTTKIPQYRKQMKQLLDKIEETSKEVTEQRSSVSFSPKDVKEVEQWTSEYKQHPNAIVKFYSTWKSMKPVISQHHEDEDSEVEFEGDSDSEEEKPKSKKRKSKTKERNTEKAQQKASKANARDKEIEQSENVDDMEDIVEDFRLSSGDEG
ncbi:nucleolar complex protein 2 homolog [Nematostella vectensis]|uniref:nucleolar complex protein 2 homolog n=1 Tax=Nematostella vectensis TaxID=45351 RepID=UPI0013903C88|nr:nucleolar complex protein 2 homolog [Nematostella vectensis]